MVIVYLLRFSKNDVPVMPVLVHYSSHVNSGTKI
ncbi:hypothetical protein T01_7478 [Trichinella spiralis]|uniref:Uncharacterized protein n=1 Tax=Trichinella spiralis TaxID=6334 RepID=A0A0V0YPY1_TRISP|nr:hypothetical protein T01_7478 [Trichinella spiralis]